MSFLCKNHLSQKVRKYLSQVLFSSIDTRTFSIKSVYFFRKSIKSSRNNVEALSLAFLFDCPSDSDMKHLRGFVTSVFGYRKYRNVRFIGNK